MIVEQHQRFRVLVVRYIIISYQSVVIVIVTVIVITIMTIMLYVLSNYQPDSLCLLFRKLFQLELIR
jgi:hypothetical protein